MRDWILLIILCICQASREKSIQQKLMEKKDKPLVVLDDGEVNYLLYNSKDDWLILFYDSDIKTTSILLGAWEVLAKDLDDQEFFVNVGRVNLREKNMGSFSRLKLYRYPCAIFLRGNYYYNYTGLLDYNSMMNLMKNQKYLLLDKLEVPDPFGYYDMAILL